jgi:hypothetical protein
VWHLIVASALLIVLILINHKLNNHLSLRRLLTYLAVNAGIGILIDYVIGYKLHLWVYNHHSYWLPDYFLYLIPAWSLTLTIFTLFYSALEKAIRNIYIRLVIYFAVIPLQQEFMGAWRQSWSYNASIELIISGWILLMAYCVFIKQIADWISTQNYKIETFIPAKVEND